jgi:hypothetical protein
MMGGAKARYDDIIALSQTDSTEDLKKINVTALVIPRARAFFFVCILVNGPESFSEAVNSRPA